MRLSIVKKLYEASNVASTSVRANKKMIESSSTKNKTNTIEQGYCDLFDNIKHSFDQHYESVRVSAVFECVTTMVKP